MEADQATWWETFGKLQRIMRKAAQVLFIAKKLDREQMHNYFMSGTEYNPYFFLQMFRPALDILFSNLTITVKPGLKATCFKPNHVVKCRNRKPRI